MQTYHPTISQNLILMDQMVSPSSAKYNIGGYAILKGSLNIPLFKKALHHYIEHQEGFSTIFNNPSLKGHTAMVRGQISQGFVLEELDFTPSKHPETDAECFMKEAFSQPFDLNEKPLFRFCLLKLRKDLHYWFACVHHLIADGWSFMLLLNGVAENYSSLSSGKKLQEEHLYYSHYAEEDKLYYASPSSQDDRAYWMKEFNQASQSLFTPQSESKKTHKAQSEVVYLNEEQVKHLQNIAHHHKVSLYQLVLSVLLLYFGRCSGHEDLTIGMPVLNRSRKVYRKVFGVFMNLLAVKFPLAPEMRFDHFLQKVKGKMREVLRHQRYQYGNLIKDLQAAQGRKRLYDIRFSYENFEFTSEMAGLETTACAMSNLSEEDPLSIYMREYHGNGFDIRLVYNTRYLSQQHLQAIKKHLYYVLTHLSANCSQSIGSFPIMPEQEVQAILAKGTGQSRVRTAGTFFQHWQQVLRQFGDHVAVVTPQRVIAYKTLHQKALQLAGALQQKGLQPGDRVGIMPSRNEDIVIGMWACLFAGYPYVPLDPEYPAKRLAYMWEDSACQLLLHSGNCRWEQAANLPSMSIQQPETSASHFTIPNIRTDHPAYVIYTSGTTGKPKGVLISYASLLDYTWTFGEYFHLTEQDKVVQQAAISFDTSVEEIYPILFHGGELHILPDRHNLDALNDMLKTAGITLLSTNPQTVNYLNGKDMGVSLRVLISGGDVLKPEYINHYPSSLKIYNTYGPTESTVCASFQQVSPGQTSIPIGKAITNRELLILDKQKQALPFNTPGELYIGGKGLALNYLNQPDSAQEKLIEHPWKPGQRLYRTGDRALMHSDGTVEFLGRIDAQISLRGYRIEAKEVELAIMSTGLVEDVVVDVREQAGYPVLTCWYLNKENAPSHPKAWKEVLADTLPEYMIPKEYVEVTEFPTLPNGKVNRKALCIPKGIQRKPAPHTQTPFTPGEKRIALLWEEVLQKPFTDTNISFFDLGGHSLTALQLLSKLRNQFEVNIEFKDLFEHPTIREQALFIDHAAKGSAVNIPTAPDNVDYPLSSPQHRLWVLSQLGEASEAYHISGALRLQGKLQESQMSRAVEQLLVRHESLRTVFIEQEEGTPRQLVKNAQTFISKVFFTEDFTKAVNQEEALTLFIKQLLSQPFDLENGPLLRVWLLRKSPQEHLLVYVMHHIISDGWSLEVLLREFTQIYLSLVQKENIPLPVLPVQFKDYVVWQEGNATHTLKKAGEFWKNRFADKIPVLELPLQKPRPSVKGYQGKELKHFLPNASVTQLKTICQEEGATLFMGLFACLNALLFRYTGQESTVIGTPVANRDQTELQGLVGLFLNILPIRTDIPENTNFRQLLQTQKSELLASFQNGHYPLEQLVTALDYKVDPSRSPLFDVMIVLHNQAEMAPESWTNHTKELKITPYTQLPKETSQFDLVFSFLQEHNGMSLSVEYSTDIFEEWFVEQLMHHFVQITDALTHKPEEPIRQINFFLSQEYQSMSTGGYCELATDSQKTALDFMLETARNSPQQTAVEYGQYRLNYQELHNRAAQACTYLQSIGIQPGDTVGIRITASHHLPALIYGLWMAGAIYVPINPKYPELRQQTIAEDATCKRVITDEHLPTMLNYKQKAFGPGTTPEATAYILYTSGTSGKPKGVSISHAALSDKLQVELDLLKLQKPCNTCLLTNYCFDVSLLELFLPAYTGGTLLIPDTEMLLQYDDLVLALANGKVNLLQGTPTFLESFFRYLTPDTLQPLAKYLEVICSGGESLHQTLVTWIEEKLPDVRLNNHYGPTESTIDALVYQDVQDMQQNRIGKPLANTSAYILDKTGQLVPYGVNGELYIGGKSLAKGYLNKPQQTTQQFIPHPFKQEEKLYKTGDLASQLPDGTILFRGRVDEQMKVRGMRIEPEEICRQIEKLKGVEQAVVVYHAPLLLSFISTDLSEKEDLSVKVKKQLQDTLPDYMVPNQVIALEEIPLNANGKVNKARLIEWLNDNPAPKEVQQASTETEHKLMHIWEKLLPTHSISASDHFFDLGGNSLLLVRLRAEIKKNFGLNLEIKELFRTTILREQAEMLDELLWLQQPEEQAPDHPMTDEIIL
ncbi:amino acid adenylation domain-containing protein [Rapidithrix thailandica]|uniref:Amino acid adenylation domain-containing protein n=1 Tax=Rapidithrix thailandica TaxID=413964 RepID=A0AAW9SH60_9BACT